MFFLEGDVNMLKEENWCFLKNIIELWEVYLEGDF